MKRIRKIEFINHPILNNLKLDFCDNDGNPLDTIIFAGENGTGKTTILSEIHKITTDQFEHEVILEIENNGVVTTLHYFKEKFQDSFMQMVKVNGGKPHYKIDYSFRKEYRMSGLFSTVDINFVADQIRSVTTKDLDLPDEDFQSSTDLATNINQLLVDIQYLDDDLLAQTYKEYKSKGWDTNKIEVKNRMSRFLSAFTFMFDNLEFSHICNNNEDLEDKLFGKGYKDIIFKKNGKDVSIRDLSSGEKQIIYRGCFILKNIQLLNDAFICIDEPEISMHPVWQERILDYYKNMLIDENGVQTSQLFVATHSPFVIHNENRKNDKVIILNVDENKNISVSEEEKFYNCSSIEIVKQAFNTEKFKQLISSKPIVFLEGRTDEKYFNKAIETFRYKNLPFEFKWIGHLDEKGQEVNTGKDALNKAYHFLKAHNRDMKFVLLYDNDANKITSSENNIIIYSLPKYEDKVMNCGIENILITDSLNLNSFYEEKIKKHDYGEITTIKKFKKMEFCEYICSLPKNDLIQILENVKKEIDKLIEIISK